MFLGITHTPHVRQFGVVRTSFLEHLAKQTSVSGIIFNQEKYFHRLFAHPFCLCCGNLTFVSQKSLMLFTRASNASNWRIAAVTRVPSELSSGLSMISIGNSLPSFRRP